MNNDLGKVKTRIFQCRDLLSGETCLSVTETGSYCVGNPSAALAPSNNYGILLYFNTGSYKLRMYVDSANNFYVKMWDKSWKKIG